MTFREGEITELLQQLGQNRSAVEAKLLELVHDDLRAVAGRLMSAERADHTLQPTVLVDDAWMKLSDERKHEWKSREQFLALAALAMRRMLVHHVRDRRRAKRGGDRKREVLDSVIAHYTEERRVDVLALDAALRKLAAEDVHASRLVELRFFGGMSLPEAARVLDVSMRTAERVWTRARAWLRNEMKDGTNR